MQAADKFYFNPMYHQSILGRLIVSSSDNNNVKTVSVELPTVIKILFIRLTGIVLHLTMIGTKHKEPNLKKTFLVCFTLVVVNYLKKQTNINELVKNKTRQT